MAQVGVFGGSGFYAFLDDISEVMVETPFGAPSAPLAIGKLGQREVVFLPRHGTEHEYPPHAINYRANLWAMKELGVSRVIGPCSAGSLRRDIEPGHFVICDQLVDRTSGRADTYYEGPTTAHVSFADPYCSELRALALDAARSEGVPVHERGTVVVIPGPRFSTRAESRHYQDAGWDVVNMTQYPEAYLARELEICYVNISLVTDYDAGLDARDEPVTKDEVIRVFDQNLAKLRGVLSGLIPQIPERRSCPCATALEGARF